MSTPDIKETEPTKPHARPRNLFKNQLTGEYSICVKGPNKNRRWISLHTRDREEAIRRLIRTGVGKVVELGQDERFTEKVVEVLTSGPKKTLESVYDEWYADTVMRLRRGSVAHYRVIGRQFLNLFPPQTEINHPTAIRVSAWINTAPSLTRRQRRMQILESFFQFAFDQGYRKDNLGKRLALRLEDLTFDQMERVIKEPFTEIEYTQLLHCRDIQGFWRWAIQLSWWLGLRMSDVCLLQWGSFCAVPGKLVVWQHKTRVRNQLNLADPVLGGGIVSQIMEEIKAEASDAVYCFPDMRDLYNSRQWDTVYLFRQCCFAAGLDGTKTFHCFRKSAALRWEAAGRSLREIGALLGHEGTGNTGFYLEKTS